MTKTKHGGRREGAGAPQKWKDRASLKAYIERELLDQLDRKCQAQGKSRGDVITVALHKLFKQGV